MERAIRDNINPRFFSLIPIASIPIFIILVTANHMYYIIKYLLNQYFVCFNAKIYGNKIKIIVLFA